VGLKANHTAPPEEEECDIGQFAWPIAFALSEGKRVEKLRYIHRNPVRRGLVERPEDWKWSSFLH